MYGRETRMLLKHYLDQGLSKAELSRRFGVSRRTVGRWIASGDLDRDFSAGERIYAPRPRPAHKLDPYREMISAVLADLPKLSARRVFEDVRKAGYTGCYERVRAYVREVRPRPPDDPVVRFETPPGLQGQAGSASFRLPWGRRHALVVVLGHSRLLWFRYYPRQTMAHLTEGLESAFAAFGGVPRELLFDQMRAVVTSDDREAGGGITLNAKFQRFAAHWGFTPRACRPYRARTKGKVERPIRYIRDGFFYGRSFAGDGDLNGQAAAWLEGTANARIHGTTGERPSERFERAERAALLPLAPCPFRSLGLPREAAPEPAAAAAGVTVEKRPLSVYAEVLQ